MLPDDRLLKTNSSSRVQFRWWRKKMSKSRNLLGERFLAWSAQLDIVPSEVTLNELKHEECSKILYADEHPSDALG